MLGHFDAEFAPRFVEIDRPAQFCGHDISGLSDQRDDPDNQRREHGGVQLARYPFAQSVNMLLLANIEVPLVFIPNSRCIAAMTSFGF